jgi:ATP-binding cassette subfamily B protein
LPDINEATGFVGALAIRSDFFGRATNDRFANVSDSIVAQYIEGQRRPFGRRILPSPTKTQNRTEEQNMSRRYPCVRQSDQNDCGPAALATISRYFRQPIDLQKLRSVAGTDRAGTNLIGLMQAAERIGLQARAVRGPYEALGSISLPVIAHVQNERGLGHFVVVYQANAKRTVIADPEKGVLKLAPADFQKTWTGNVLLVSPGNDRISPDNESSLKCIPPSRRFWSLLLGQRQVLVEAAACGILMTLLGLSTSFFIRHLVDSVLVRGESGLLNALGIGMLVVALFRTLFGSIRKYMLAHVSRRLDMTLLSRFSRHIHKLPVDFFEARQVGDILSRVSDASKVRDAISGITLTALVDGALVLMTSAFLWMYDAHLAIVSSLFVPVILIVVWTHHHPSRRLSRKSMEDNAKLSAHLVEDISSVATVKAFNASRHRVDEAERRVVQVAQSGFGLHKLNISMSAFGGATGTIASLIVLWYGGHRVIAGAITIGELMFFHTLLGYMLGPVESLASVHLQFQEALIAVDRFYQILDADEEPSTPDGAIFQRVEKVLELRDVSFAYGCRENVLHGLSMSIAAGQTVAIVGESGCGKSTLLKLLMRYHDVKEGRVSVDGVDLRDFNLESWRSRIGLVAQDPHIFNGSIRENITMGADVDFLDVVRAAKTAGLEEVIANMPERFETQIGERGANLSGGQRQRLAIARAVIRDPDIFLFDEATSNLDSGTEEVVRRNLTQTLHGKTAVIVAHRLSTIRDADRIFVMHRGQIVESGTHDELLQIDSRYSQLWKAQSRDGTAERIRQSPNPAWDTDQHANLTTVLAAER